MNQDLIDEKLKQLVKIHETRNPFKLAKALGVVVQFEELVSIYGYYNKLNRIKMIHININSTDSEAIFTCGHELGHAIFHPQENTPKLSKITISSEYKIEREANYFATKLLIDDSHKDFDFFTKSDIINYYGLPKEMERFI